MKRKKSRILSENTMEFPLLFRSRTKKRSGFTLPELIVVVAILAILSTAAFVSYSSSNVEARDAMRKSDMGNLKVGLRSVKQKNGAYPQVTGSTTKLTYGSTNVATQGKILSDLPLASTQVFEDPKTKSRYLYSSIENGQEFQVGMMLENGSAPIAYVDGEYRSVSPAFPSILLAASGTSYDLQTAANQKLFLLNGNSKNLPYDLNGQVLQTAANLTEAIGSAGTGSTATFFTCRAIYDARRSIGSGTYYLRSSTGSLSLSGCTMAY